MSTKIYDGFRVTGLDYPSLHEELISLGEEARSVAAEEFASWFANTIVDNNDRAAWRARLGLESDYPVTYFQVQDLYRERTMKIRSARSRDPEVDWGFEVSFAPAGDGRWLGIPFTEKESLMTCLASRDWHEPYGYWNNSEPPAGLTDREWLARRDEWSRILGCGIPSRTMATFQLVCDIDLGLVGRSDIVSRAPGTEERTRRVVEDLARHRYMASRGELSTIPDVMGALFAFRDGFLPGGELWHLSEECEPLAREVVESKTPEQMLTAL